MRTFLIVLSIFSFLTGCTISNESTPVTTDSTVISVDTLRPDSVIVKDTITINSLE